MVFVTFDVLGTLVISGNMSHVSHLLFSLSIFDFISAMVFGYKKGESNS